jgi:hypothetical protein
MIGVIPVHFQKLACVEKWKEYISKMGLDDESVLIQFKKCAAVEKCNSTILWNWTE